MHKKPHMSQTPYTLQSGVKNRLHIFFSTKRKKLFFGSILVYKDILKTDSLLSNIHSDLLSLSSECLIVYIMIGSIADYKT
jgi:hypothetical protein